MQNETPVEKLCFEKGNYAHRDIMNAVRAILPFSLNERSEKQLSDNIAVILTASALEHADNSIAITDHWCEQAGNSHCADMIAADIESRVIELRATTTPIAAISVAAAD